MSEGIVYVLTNPAMPGMVKIWKTGREVEARLNDLYTTGVPLPFECTYAARVLLHYREEVKRHLQLEQEVSIKELTNEAPNKTKPEPIYKIIKDNNVPSN